MAQEDVGQIQKIQPQDPQYTLQDHITFKRKQQAFNKNLKQYIQNGLSEFELTMDGISYAYTKLSLINKSLKQINQILWQYPHLRKIQLSFNRLLNINSLFKLKYIIQIDLSKNQMKDIKFLSNPNIFPYLKSINLSGNKIQSLPLIQLKNLKYINLNNNYINNLQDFQGHLKLQRIQLRGNKISNLKGLKNLLSLIQLYIADNLLDNLNDIQNTPKLTKIHARKNKINKLIQFSDIKSLTYLNLRQNTISKVDDIAGIPSNVSILNLLANPISQQLGDNTKKQIFMKFRQYNKINKIQITNQEKQQYAKEYKQKLAELQRQRLEKQAAQRQAAEQLKLQTD